MTSIKIDRLDGLSSSVAIKGPCRVVATANILLTGLQTIDGVALESGDRVLVAAQKSVSENGIYVVDTGPWRRARDFNKTRDVVKGTQILITDGTVHAQSGCYVASEDPIYVGSSDITILQNIILNPAQLELLVQAAQEAADAAQSAETAAEDAADRAEAAAASLNLPDLTDADANKVLTVNSDGSGYEVKLLSEDSVTNEASDALRITIGNIAYPARYGTYDPTGVADSTAAINAALSSKKYVEPGEGDFRISSKVVIGSNYRMLKGYGPGITRLLSYSAANPVIEIAAGLEGINIDGFTVAHAVTPTNGGNGITALGDLAMSSIKRMNAVANYSGMTLRSTGYSKLEEIFLSNNLGDGLIILNTAGHAACQWYIDDVLSQANGGRGAFVQSIPGASGLLLGDWSRFRTFANSGFGIALLGTASEPVQAFRLHESFLGSDGAGELYLDTYGFGHKIHDTFFERSGLDPTGPTLTTPASGVGWGIQATANNTDFRVDNSSISYCSQGGVYSEAGKLRLTTVFFDHLTAGVNVANGNTYREVGCDYVSVTAPRTIVTNPQGAIIVGSDTGSAGANPTRIPGGITVGNATGGDPGAGLVNVAGGLLKNNTAYNNP